MGNPDRQDLLDYRRRVAKLYGQARDGEAAIEQRWQAWRRGRDALFGQHPQSALTEAQKKDFKRLAYYPYDAQLRFLLPLDTKVEAEVFEIPLQDDGAFKMQRFGKIHFSVEGREVSLSLFWILGYGGGVFLPFRDGTNKTGETYGGGRYLLDTIKHADLGEEAGKLVIDFNFAYNPSCAYNSRWHCPLAPQENWLPILIGAGEKAYPDAH